MWSTLKKLDAYPKLLEEVRVRTLAGGFVTVGAAIIMTVLFFSELSFFLSPRAVDHLVVDTGRSETLHINIDITFPATPCSLLSIDAVDVSGTSQKNVDHHVIKYRLDEQENVINTAGEKEELGGVLAEEAVLAKVNSTTSCGSCYGAEAHDGDCCNTCESVKDAYRRKGWMMGGTDHIEQCNKLNEKLHRILDKHEGCRITGYLEVAKVAGKIHFAPGDNFQSQHEHDHDMEAFEAGLFNVSHRIASLSFGDVFPGIINPLDNVVKQVEEGGTVFQYYIKIVPTTFEFCDGQKVITNQFSVTEHATSVKERSGLGLPGVFLHYDISPIKVEFTQSRRSFFHFVTQLCAIIGGVYTVAGLVDKLLYQSMRQAQKKNMGKFG